MDHATNDCELGHIGRINSSGSSIRRRSLSLSSSVHPDIDDDIESETVSQAGDIGDRVLQSGRYIDTIVSPAEKIQENTKLLPQSLDYISYLIHLAVFGILGVLTRYLLQRLFGPGVAGVTSHKSILYLDLVANSAGSYLMGWFGVVFKGDISSVSEHLATAITTGYLGSVTTFSAWNQEILDLSVDGEWVSAVLCFVVGLILVDGCFSFGVQTAEGFRMFLERIDMISKGGGNSSIWRADSYKRHLAVMVLLMLMLGILWGVSGALERSAFKSGGSEAQLWLACLVGPLGVWIRWFLARLNGRGLGRSGSLKWVPWGTLIANVSAACVMAGLATLKKAVNTKDCNTVASGIQLGLLGCLSTVSTFVAEFDAMRQSNRSRRAFAYAIFTSGLSFVLGTLIYSTPVWAKAFG